MAPWAARLFGPGQPASGVAVELKLEHGVLIVEWRGAAPLRIAAVQLSARYSGFNHRQFELAWRDGAGAWACHLAQPADIASLLASWPPALASVTARLSPPPRRLLSWPALGVLIGLPLLLLALVFGARERLVDFITAQIAPSVERQIGAAAMAQVRATTELISEGDQWQALNTVANAVAGADTSAYRFHLAADDGVNAFALPGGDIVVNRGLLLATHNPDELAGVLAHEIQHVALRHSVKGVVRGAGLSLLWSLLLGDAGATVAGQAADRLLSLKFSRDAEREADAAGFSLLVERRIDPRGMVNFFASLAAQDAATAVALLATHPASAEREAVLKARMTALAPQCCRPLPVTSAWPPPN